MLKKSLYKLFTIVLGILIIVAISSCGGTRNDEPLVGDQAFPGDSGATTVSDFGNDSSTEEAEVLRLLGISKDESQTTETTTTEPTAEKVEDLQGEVGEKDVQIANLQAQLQERENRIQNLQRMKEERAAQAGTSSVSAPVMAAPNTFKGQYEQALAMYNNRNYQQALSLFNQLLDKNVQNSLVDNCQYWKGECQYGMRDYNQAALEFQKVFVYDDSNKLDDAQLKLGLCYKMLGDVERARVEFNKVINNYPDSEYVSRAQTYLSEL